MNDGNTNSNTIYTIKRIISNKLLIISFRSKKFFAKTVKIFDKMPKVRYNADMLLIETEKEKEGYIKSVKSLLKDCENMYAIISPPMSINAMFIFI